MLFIGGPVQFLNTAFGVWFTEIFAFLAAGWILLRRTGRDPLSFVGADRFDPMEALLGFALGAANFIGVVVPLQYLQQPLIPQWLKDQFDASRLFQNQRPVEIAIIILGISIAAPFCEEFVFRGIIQKGLVARFTPRVALIATAMLFSAYHLDPVGFVARVELGLLFGALYQRSGTIWPGAMAHAANNLVSATLFLIAQRMAAPTQEEPAWQSVVVLSLFGLAVMGALWRAVIRRRPEPASMAQEEHASPSDLPTQPEAVGPIAPDPVESPFNPPSLARLLCPQRGKYAVWIAFLDGEEAVKVWSDSDGRYGSRQMAARLSASGDLKKIRAFLLADIVGGRKAYFPRESSSTPALVDLVWNTAAKLGYSGLFLNETASAQDDHDSFMKRGVPAVDVIADFMSNGYWHTPQDSLDKISAKTLAITGHVFLESVKELQTK